MNMNDYHLARRKMVEQQLRARGVRNEGVLEAMGKVPRHAFVEQALQHEAYSDHPLPIGEAQTISQPYIVALMTEALDLTGSENVLEIGTGSGYQTAILAELSYRVFTVERIRSLLTKARETLEALNYHNIRYKLGDGSLGWAEEGPYEAIIVTAGAPEVPQPLIDQLAVLGRLVIPVGESRGSQSLLKLVKTKTQSLSRTDLGGCRFVDLVGDYGWPRSKDKRGIPW
jgi:protein-L-isoaspartate(D-aspartate) O-methyltransferase